MNYVFFDVECANCLNGEGKMCSFGFVKTDEAFHILKKKDILMNPNAKFLLGNVRTGEGIKLAYPLYRFQRAFTFPKFYQEIKELLEDKDTICFGFAVHQDVSYLSYTCTRYSLPVIRFRFFDIQKMEQRMYQRKNPSGLDHLIEQFSLNSFTYHRSDDDALMTMEVFLRLLQEKNITVKESLELYPDCLNDTDYFLFVLKENRLRKEKKKEVSKKREEFFNCGELKEDLSHFDKFFWKKKFFVFYSVFAEEADEILKYKEVFYKKGGKIVYALEEADYIVLFDRKELENTRIPEEKKRKLKCISYRTFIENLKK